MMCPKCLTGRTDDVVGAPCKTPGCDGTIQETPAFSTLVDELPEPMTCGRRFDMYPGGIPVHQDREVNQDHWQRFKTNGNRVCSYCGSLHPDDLFELVRACANAPEDAPYMSVPEIEPSDKPYKIYVHQPGVRNAYEGGIKFYTPHLPRDAEGKIVVTDEQQDEYARAIKASDQRFARHLAERRGGMVKENNLETGSGGTS